jgi:hypothetical protein
VHKACHKLCISWLGLVKIGERFGLVAHRRFGVPVILPDSDHDDGKQHRVENTDHGEFETAHLVVKAEAVGAPRRRQSISPML